MRYALAIGKNQLGKNHSVITEKLAVQKLLLWQLPITNYIVSDRLTAVRLVRSADFSPQKAAD